MPVSHTVIARRTLSLPILHWVRAKWKRVDYATPAGWVRLGSLRRVTPLSSDFGYDRGRPIDRFYIEKFMADHEREIQGHVLEIADDTYTRQFGGDRVVKSDVLHVSAGDPKATLVGDLTSADHIPSDTFDCIVITQTLQLIYDVRAALQTIYRILKPGGVVIATLPGISSISRYDAERWGHYWGFTSLSARRLFCEIFPQDHVQIGAYGNVLSAAGFLYGLATEELKQSELEHFDPDYEVIIGVRAGKTANEAF
jgi:SAM-dependent methyltransferase